MTWMHVAATDPCDGFRCPPTFGCHLDELRRPVCRCSDTCSSQVAPVCASDGRTYRNECRMRLHACKTSHDLHVIFQSDCSAGEPVICPVSLFTNHTSYIFTYLLIDDINVYDVTLFVSGLNTCSKPHWLSTCVAQSVALRAATPVTEVRIPVHPTIFLFFFCFVFFLYNSA